MARDDGFTLLEVVIAFVILVLAMAIVVGRLGIAIRSLGIVDADHEAALVADRIMTELGHSRPLTYGVSEGDLPEGQHWRLLITPTRERPAGAALPRLEAHDVALTISWRDRAAIRRTSFKTIRLGVEQ
jgi:general secretion pathway protein I